MIDKTHLGAWWWIARHPILSLAIRRAWKSGRFDAILEVSNRR